ncbi:MAG TPA: patatin-like phospholipase family protein [Geminicoccaceae bacterium]|mgnify:CR=1 FL=1|nr:patatin-like phospholipase family protein [Geminicoccus sp.]HMU52231.1 patatin-like phospholipase family protein [Geminicoccaceae bacterium]
MSGQRRARPRPPRDLPRPPFEQIALLLQGGGALGSYQAGVYEALAEAGLHPDWVAGISIGAVNSAIIAGNSPDKRVERLRAFWEMVSEPPLGIPFLGALEGDGVNARTFANQLRALGVLLGGAPGFFAPRLPPPFLLPPGSPGAASFYDTTPLRATLLDLVDFDRLNDGGTRLSVGAVNVRSGNFVYFDTATRRVGPEHIIASGSLPPGFPAQEIDGEHYWDGGLVSNTPLEWVLGYRPRRDTLAFQVDLWSARGELPGDLAASEVRQKEIRFSSRTRDGTDDFKRAQQLRRAVSRLLRQLPEELRHSPEAELLRPEACEKVFNIVQLIYRAHEYEGISKDYEFSRRTMEEHWQAGYRDCARSLCHPGIMERPEGADGVFTFDIAEHGGK